MKSAVIYLDRDPLPPRLAEFLRVARREHRALDPVGAAPYPAHTGRHLIELADRVYEDIEKIGGAPRLDHLALIMHGSTTALLRPGSYHGLHAHASRPPRLYRASAFAQAWRPVLNDGALVSLCACLCGRDPRWYLRQLFGYAPGAWGPRSYRSGGRRSFAARLRDAFAAVGRPVGVRAHTVVGHVTGSPMLRVFSTEAGAPGRTLFQLALPGIEPTRSVRRKWVRLVRGELARDWLMGDESVVDRIRERWPYEGHGGAVS